MSKLTALNTDSLMKALDKVPRKVRLDIVQLGLDLIGIVDQSGTADTANAFISLLRGDLLGAAISAVSVFPLGDVAKVARFEKYARSMAELVSIARRQPQLAWALRTPMRQFRELLNSIRSFMGDQALLADMVRHLDHITASLNRYFAKITLVERFGWERMARKLGSSGGQYVGHGDSVVTVNRLVDILSNAARSSKRAVKDEAEDFLGKLALSDGWKITAGIHPSASDASRHITVAVEGIAEQFHLYIDGKGFLTRITHGKKAELLNNLPRW